MIFKPLLVLSLLISLLLSNEIDNNVNKEITLQWLEDKPRSIAKDYYINLFLNQENITATDTINALGMAYNVNNTLFFSYANSLKHDETLAVSQCLRASSKELIKTYADCIVSGLSIKEASTLDALQLDEVILRVEKIYPKYASLIKIINAPIPFTKLISKDKDTIYEIYLNSSNKFLEHRLNYKIPKRKIEKIKDDDRFNKLLQRVITNKKLNIAQKAFFEIDDINLSAESSFYLAVNLINHNKTKEALLYLDNSYTKAKNQKQKDRATFWKYKILEDQVLLNELLLSKNINLYTTLAYEISEKTNDNIKTKISIHNVDNNDIIHINSLFDWINIVNNTIDIDKETFDYYTESLDKPTYISYLNNKFYKNNNYFINPYNKIIKTKNLKRRALINAIAKSKSNFIKESVSSSLNIGVMQIDPIDFSLKRMMFSPEESISYANDYLDNLEKDLKDIYSIVYAYNSSVKQAKALKSKTMQENTFEPYMSMEMLYNEQLREETKDILTNYVIYYNLESQESVKIKNLLKF